MGIYEVKLGQGAHERQKTHTDSPRVIRRLEPSLVWIRDWSPLMARFGTRSPPWAKLRDRRSFWARLGIWGPDMRPTALVGLDVESGALSGLLSGTVSIGATREANGLGMASLAMTREAACFWRTPVDKTIPTGTVPKDTTRLSNMASGDMTWLWSGARSLHWTLVWSGARSLHWTLVRGSEPALDSGQGLGACTGLWSGARSLHWTLVRGSEPALDSGQGLGACTGLWSGARSLHWTLVRGSEPALDSGQGLGACTGLWSGARSLHWTLVRGSEPALDSGQGLGACTGLWTGARSELRGWSRHGSELQGWSEPRPAGLR